MKIFRSILMIVTMGISLGASQLAEATLTDFSNGGSGTLYTGGGSGLSQVIPDNTPAGVGYALNFAPSGLNINNITVSLNLSGGYNGDIYAYISHGSQIAYLLNANSAVSGSGFNVTFIEGTGNPVPTGGSGVLAGNNYTATAASDLAAFNNTDPNGAWTLFFADLSAGDTSTLNSFSVSITAVPEPITRALLIFGGLLLTTGLTRHFVFRRPLRGN